MFTAAGRHRPSAAPGKAWATAFAFDLGRPPEARPSAANPGAGAVRGCASNAMALCSHRRQRGKARQRRRSVARATVHPTVELTVSAHSLSGIARASSAGSMRAITASPHSKTLLWLQAGALARTPRRSCRTDLTIGCASCTRKSLSHRHLQLLASVEIRRFGCAPGAPAARFRSMWLRAWARRVAPRHERGVFSAARALVNQHTARGVVDAEKVTHLTSNRLSGAKRCSETAGGSAVPSHKNSRALIVS